MKRSDSSYSPGFSRRHILASGALAAGAAGLGWGTRDVVARASDVDTAQGASTVPFYGEHQAGIATPPQAWATFAAFDLAAQAQRSDVIGVLTAWTEDAARLTQGKPGLADIEPELAANPSRLTVTIGLGPRVFAVTGTEQHRPPWIAPLPRFDIDALDDRFTGGDLLLQVCADDPIPVAHAIRVLSRSVKTRATVRWVQRGFRDARGSVPEGTTMRNLMGQVDGTNNPSPKNADFDRLVWHNSTQFAWLNGGTSMVVRRIEMELDTWDELGRNDRELSMGRTLVNGAPLTGKDEHDEPDFDAKDRFGIPIIPPSSHIARARALHPDEEFFRRAYNYDDPPSPGQVSNSGLIFATFQADIEKQFLPVQQRLAEFDVLNEWTTPVGSAVFAIPPGCEQGDFIGRPLMG